MASLCTLQSRPEFIGFVVDRVQMLRITSGADGGAVA
jgi:hypothetical protein